MSFTFSGISVISPNPSSGIKIQGLNGVQTFTITPLSKKFVGTVQVANAITATGYVSSTSTTATTIIRDLATITITNHTYITPEQTGLSFSLGASSATVPVPGFGADHVAIILPPAISPMTYEFILTNTITQSFVIAGYDILNDPTPSPNLIGMVFPADRTTSANNTGPGVHIVFDVGETPKIGDRVTVTSYPKDQEWYILGHFVNVDSLKIV